MCSRHYFDDIYYEDVSHEGVLCEYVLQQSVYDDMPVGVYLIPLYRAGNDFLHTVIFFCNFGYYTFKLLY